MEIRNGGRSMFYYDFNTQIVVERLIGDLLLSKRCWGFLWFRNQDKTFTKTMSYEESLTTYLYHDVIVDVDNLDQIWEGITGEFNNDHEFENVYFGPCP